MLNLIVMAAAASANIPAADLRTVMVDGSPVTYQSEQRPDGTRRLYGRNQDSQTPFEFLVRPNGQVNGHVGRDYVEFRVSTR